MDQTIGSRPSGIPRFSRLPRPSASRESLKQPHTTASSNPRLRTASSREQLSASTRAPYTTSGFPKSREQFPPLREIDSTRNVVRKPSSETPLRKAPVQKDVEIIPRPDDGAELEVESAIDEQVEGTPIRSSQVSRKPRLSLSERTMETLQNIPSSPAIRRRKSSFFGAETPTKSSFTSRPSSRPSSSYQNDASMRPPSRSVHSRPNSSGQNQPNFRASTNTHRPSHSSAQTSTPAKRPGTAKSLKTPSSFCNSVAGTPVSSSKLPSPRLSLQPSSPSPTKSSQTPALKTGSKTVGARSVRPKASLNGLFHKPSQTFEIPESKEAPGEAVKSRKPIKKTPAAISTSSDVTSSSSGTSNRTSITSPSSDGHEPTSRKTSLALRDQIAKAKAAKRAAGRQVSSTSNREVEVPLVPTENFDFGLSDDPFNQQAGQNSAKGLLRKRIDSARADGRLNIAAMGFKQIPDEVMTMYTLDAVSAGGGSWAESVDLTRLIAADNELELIDDSCFPDVDPQAATDSDDGPGNQFGGLETLDLHGNILIALPSGLRMLECLTTLNLSNNKLTNDCFHVVSQILSLRDLKIAGNDLSGMLSSDITKLQNLELLDLQRNTLTTLPENISALRRLRVLNIQQNQLTSLDFETLRDLPLIELQASKNKLAGVLLPEEVQILPTLQILDVACNNLTSLAACQGLQLPSLHRLSCSANRLESLPQLSSWPSLLTLIADENHLAAIPDGFVDLLKVKHVDFSGNNIRLLDDNIGGMENLDIFRISGNPLKEKKFASMSTEELKRNLKARMDPVDLEGEDASADGAFYSAPNSPSRPSSSSWPIRAGGVLDRSNTQSNTLDPVIAAAVASENIIKSVELHHNSFSQIPNSIAFFAATLTSLSLAHNELTSDAFTEDSLELPALRELNISSNKLDSLQPIIQHMQAPSLEKLDVSFNRLIDLPPLKLHFPNLTSLLASNNAIQELRPEAVKGLRSLDCSSNDIASLNARIGLLGGSGGLEWLDVRGNRFRVPKYTVLEKGTEATLAWLKDRIPADEVASYEVD